MSEAATTCKVAAALLFRSPELVRQSEGLSYSRSERSLSRPFRLQYTPLLQLQI